MNLLEIEHDLNHNLLEFTEEQILHTKNVLASDSEFLARNGIMDYSLLLKVEHINLDVQESSKSYSKANSLVNEQNRHEIMTQKRTVNSILNSLRKSRQSNLSSMTEEQFHQIYHLGIIDYLQKWDISKKLEQCAKRMKGVSKNKISAVEPKLYS